MSSHGIKKLSDYRHLRNNNEMYFGSRSLHTQPVIYYNGTVPYLAESSWVPAIYTAFREILDNAMDEVIGHGFGDRIEVTFDPTTREMSVSDNGRGIPTDWDEEHRCHLATLVLSECRVGRNFDERGQVAGVNGIGASGVNFCSEYFKMDIQHKDCRFKQEFKEGNAVFGDELQVLLPKISKTKGTSGTKITFRLSSEVFSDLTFPEEFIRSRITEVAICNPLIKFFYNGSQIKVRARPEQSLFPAAKPINVEIKSDKIRSRFWLVPGWVESGEHHHTVVNNIFAFNGGVHMETFRRLFYGNLLSSLEKESKRRKLTPNRSDITEGVLIYNITTMSNSTFDSQSKTRLLNEDVGKLIKEHLEDLELYKDIIKKNREWIDAIYKRCEDRTHKKDNSDLLKSSKKNLRNKVPKLMDAAGTDRSKCILFLAEGDSAISGMGAARDPEIHGGLGMRGKVLNVSGKPPKKVLENKELADIMNVMGLSIGSKAERKSMRYGKVYIATDMDPDGLNISALLLNFFHSYWPELFDKELEPVFYLFQTPFIIAEKGKVRKYWYSHDYEDFKSEEYSGWGITRAKGLATLIEADWRYSLDHPVAFPVTDDGNMAETLNLIFDDKRADDRKVWIGL